MRTYWKHNTCLWNRFTFIDPLCGFKVWGVEESFYAAAATPDAKNDWLSQMHDVLVDRGLVHWVDSHDRPNGPGPWSFRDNPKTKSRRYALLKLLARDVCHAQLWTLLHPDAVVLLKI